jgi:hypothetical protein
MESLKDIEKHITSFSTHRRVFKQLKKFTDHKQNTWLLGCDAMYAHNEMNGSVKLFPLSGLQQNPTHSFKVDT